MPSIALVAVYTYSYDMYMYMECHENLCLCVLSVGECDCEVGRRGDQCEQSMSTHLLLLYYTVLGHFQINVLSPQHFLTRNLSRTFLFSQVFAR